MNWLIIVTKLRFHLINMYTNRISKTIYLTHIIYRWTCHLYDRSVLFLAKYTDYTQGRCGVPGGGWFGSLLYTKLHHIWTFTSTMKSSSLLPTYLAIAYLINYGHTISHVYPISIVFFFCSYGHYGAALLQGRQNQIKVIDSQYV